MSLGIRSKLTLLGVGTALVIVVVLVIAGTVLSNDFADRAEESGDALTEDNLDQLARSAEAVVSTQNDALQLRVDSSLRTLEHLLDDAGSFTREEPAVTWTATNQFTQESIEVDLPRMEIGGAWLGQTTDLDAEVPLVDELVDIAGGTATIFQRMNDDGDMLRVATNVEKLDGTRAIGTYIPATNPDGSANGVVSTVLGGETFRGVAYVVNAWYVTAYSPIVLDGEVAGIYYVGYKQESVEALRTSLESMTVGENGYVTAVSGSGSSQGNWIIPPPGAATGDNGLEATDRDGTAWLQEVVDRAVELDDGELATVRYAPEGSDDMVTARVAYFAPWDWVLIVNAFDADFDGFVDELASGRRDMVRAFLALGVVLAVLGLAGSLLFADRLVRPIRRMTGAASSLALGDTDVEIDVRSGDELGVLAASLREVRDNQSETAAVANRIADGDMDAQVARRSEKDELGKALRRMVDNLREDARRTEEIAGALRTRSGELLSLAGETSSEVDATVSAIDVATRAASDARQRSVAGGRDLADISSSMAGIVTSIEQTAKVLQQLNANSERIGEMVVFIEGIADQTNLLALNATIEAARAGESGKGFAVVAEEVKQLAVQSQASTKEIVETIERMRAASRDAVTAIEDGRAQVDGGRQVVDQASGTFEMISGGIDELTTQLGEVQHFATRIATAAQRVSQQAQELEAVRA
ncbi:MAG: methyl-accepting chemotaxis protein [Actinomycetota bacterium]|nr:methyl-accepting chemotaxis protein [Actinomycetota bacterium]